MPPLPIEVAVEEEGQMEIMETSYNDLIKWIEEYNKSQPQIKSYRGFEYSTEFANDVEDAKKGGIEFFIDPMLPIDLLAVEMREEVDDETEKSTHVSYYTLFWLALTEDPYLERRLQFYRFYLSRISKLKGVQIVIVIPANASEEFKKSLESKAKENGFGLWSVDLSKEEPEVLLSPKDFREFMEDTFQNPPKEMIRFEENIMEKKGDIVLFFEKFVHDGVEAMVGVTPKQIGKRYIERKVLDLVFELDNISYAGIIRELVTKHLVKKENDYDLVEKAFAKLWKTCKLQMNYSDFLKTFELPLYNIFPATKQGKPYRDHYLHQFQVFLLGLNIIDKLYDHFPSNMEKQWLISSSFHDMAYPIELYDKWARDFFKKSLDIPDIGVTDMKSHFVDKTLLSCMGDIINLLCMSHFDRELKGNWLAEEKKLVKFFYEKITKVKHHCVLSSISLLKQASFNLNSSSSNLLNDLFVPSSLAIALHHEVVWSELCTEHGLKNIKFEKDPLTFLLLFCDAAQEWGRPKHEYSHEENKVEESFILEDFNVTKSNCLITIRAPLLLATDSMFIGKKGNSRSYNVS